MVSPQRVTLLVVLLIGSLRLDCCAFLLDTCTHRIQARSQPSYSLTRIQSKHHQRKATVQLSNSPFSVWDTITTFSSSSSLLQTVTDRALHIPPIAYLGALLAAGIGVPVSEDGLVIFAGTVWSTLTLPRQRAALLTCLYSGVVLSDIMTFWLGRALRMGLLEPLRKQLQLGMDDEDTKEEMSVQSVDALASSHSKLRKRDKLKQVLQNSGDYAGFVIRFSVGTRGPLMLMSGFSKKVSFAKFLLGISTGALLTVPLQLWVGYSVGHKNPTAVVGIVGGISTFVLGTAAVVGLASWSTLAIKQLKKWKRRRERPLEKIERR